ncbi:MAG: hypothetical protein ACQKBV_07695, partial [Puniceicoccales bacterium]
FESDDLLFALPDVIDEEKGPYADCIDHLTAMRVKLLNDLIEFEQKFTIEELEDDLREEQNADFMEGRAIHCFRELLDILEFVPDGYELDGDDDSDGEDDIEEEFPDIDDEDEKIEEDETMKWDEDEDEEEEDGFDSEETEDLPEDDEDDDEEEEEKPARKSKTSRKK